ncbi:hypothetical protein LCGC14_1694620 [marine sediment metagenome]|uniref:Uncharacterized protein n=1 Tax=marine sediment metagenome TaxID=412755 RepID=A0A0F9HKE2_9ZZZZ
MRLFLFKIIIPLKILYIVLKYIIKRGIKLKTTRVKKFKVITEFIDPKKLNRTPYDADYWVDGANVKESDILFFLTNRQCKYLIWDGYTIGEVKKNFQDKKYELAILDNLSYSISSLRELFLIYIEFIRKISELNACVFCRILIKAWTDYLEFLPLFLNYSAKSFIYLTLPNGNTGVRFDDAIITGLCRKYGIKSYGCQTRTVYSKNFEYCFDCFDVYLSWGTAWDQVSKSKTLFINNSITVGCIYLDYLLPFYKRYLNNKNNVPKETLTVSIFPSDISHKHHYTKNFTKTFLITCAELAALFPNCKFIIKSKDPENTAIMMAEKDFHDAYCKVRHNFEFLDQARYNYADLLTSSDIVIAIGFTTPGIEGLLLGKKVICYSEWRCGGQAFKHLLDLVANNADELKRLFDHATDDYDDYSNINSIALEQLDPFRDGEALSRIGRIMGTM